MESPTSRQLKSSNSLYYSQLNLFLLSLPFFSPRATLCIACREISLKTALETSPFFWKLPAQALLLAKRVPSLWSSSSSSNGTSPISLKKISNGLSESSSLQILFFSPPLALYSPWKTLTPSFFPPACPPKAFTTLQPAPSCRWPPLLTENTLPSSRRILSLYRCLPLISPSIPL